MPSEVASMLWGAACGTTTPMRSRILATPSGVIFALGRSFLVSAAVSLMIPPFSNQCMVLCRLALRAPRRQQFSDGFLSRLAGLAARHVVVGDNKNLRRHLVR